MVILKGDFEIGLSSSRSLKFELSLIVSLIFLCTNSGFLRKGRERGGDGKTGRGATV